MKKGQVGLYTIQMPGYVRRSIYVPTPQTLPGYGAPHPSCPPGQVWDAAQSRCVGGFSSQVESFNSQYSVYVQAVVSVSCHGSDPCHNNYGKVGICTLNGENELVIYSLATQIATAIQTRVHLIKMVNGKTTSEETYVDPQPQSGVHPLGSLES